MGIASEFCFREGQHICLESRSSDSKACLHACVSMLILGKLLCTCHGWSRMSCRPLLSAVAWLVYDGYKES